MVPIEWPTAAAHAGDVMVAVSVHSQLSCFLARYRAGSVDSVLHGCYQQLLHQLKDSVSYKLIRQSYSHDNLHNRHNQPTAAKYTQVHIYSIKHHKPYNYNYTAEAEQRQNRGSIQGPKFPTPSPKTLNRKHENPKSSSDKEAAPACGDVTRSTEGG